MLDYPIECEYHHHKIWHYEKECPLCKARMLNDELLLRIANERIKNIA
jgi:hypothetical protein